MNAPLPGWRTLKEIVAHYMEDSANRDGGSGADIIRMCFKERELREKLFAHHGKGAADRLLYESDIKGLDDVVARTQAKILRLVCEQARDGKWIALGRRNPEVEHELIPPRYWPFLTLDIESNAATGDGMSFRDLRCRLMKDIPAEDPVRQAVNATEQRASTELQPPAAMDAQPPPAPSHEMPPGQALVLTGTVGRPSSMHFVEAEFRRRKAQGEVIWTSIRAEAEQL
jgi:hypothetical protein